MKKLLTATALAGAAALAAVPSGAGAQESATVSLMHGIPGATVDVAVDGAVVIPGFEPGTMQDLSSFAGDTLSNVEVRVAGSDDVVIGPIESLPVPDSGNWTVVAHLSADGTPTLTPFQNDVSSIEAGQGRLTVRHTAAAPAVDIILADGSRPFTNLSNPNQVAADLPAGPIAGAQIAPTGGEALAPVPDVDLPAGTNLIVYAVGSLEDGTLTFQTQSIGGLGGQPTAVNTGDTQLETSSSSAVLALAAVAAVFGLGSAGLVVARRRSR